MEQPQPRNGWWTRNKTKTIRLLLALATWTLVLVLFPPARRFGIFWPIALLTLVMEATAWCYLKLRRQRS